MPTHTKDLLSIRDDEPMDAALRARLLADPGDRAEIERLRAMRDALRGLPLLDPPASARARVEAAAGVAVAARRRLIRAAAAAAAAVIAALVVLTVGPGFAPDGERRGDGDVRSADTGPANRASGAAAVDAGDDAASPGAAPHSALLRESARLERLLEELPRSRPVMRAGTAGTIAVLEDHIQYIDGQLTVGAAQGLEPTQQLALWRERVDLMHALVQVRYAHTRTAVY